MQTPIDLSDFNLENGKIIEISIEGKSFKYKKPTNEDELSWAPDYMEIMGTKQVNGVEVADVRVNFGKLNFCKLQNIVEVPYSEEQIEAVIGERKPFNQLSKTKKKEFISKMNSELVGKIIKEITKVDKEEADLKKN